MPQRDGIEHARHQVQRLGHGQHAHEPVRPGGQRACRGERRVAVGGVRERDADQSWRVGGVLEREAGRRHRYRDRFADERWVALHAAGARPQRPLWASTATKDPTYSDVLYVEELVAPDVINTMPEATLRAFADHGDPTRSFDQSPAPPDEILRRAEDAGIDLAAVTADLERDGVRSFCDSYRELLDCIEAKLQRP